MISTEVLTDQVTNRRYVKSPNMFPLPEPYLEPTKELSLDEVLKFPIQFQLETYAPIWLSPVDAREANEKALAEQGTAKLWKEYYSELLKLNEQYEQEQTLAQKAQALKTGQPTQEIADTFYTHLASQVSVEDIALSQAPEELTLQHLKSVLTNRAFTLLSHAKSLTINGVPNQQTLAQEALALKITTEINALHSQQAKQSSKLANSIKDINPQFFTARLI